MVISLLHQIRWLFCLGSVLAGCVGVAHAAEQSSSELTIDRVDVGWQGQFHVGRWAPLRVQLTAAKPMQIDLTIELSAPDGNRTRIPAGSTKFDKAGSQTVETYFRPGRLEDELIVSALQGEELLASERFLTSTADDATLRPALPLSSWLIVTLGKPAGFRTTYQGDDTASSKSEDLWEVVELESADELPDAELGYDGVQALVVNGKIPISATKSDAIRGWVERGGHLIVSIGKDIEAYRQNSISRWVPVPVEGTSRLRELSSLEVLAESSSPILFLPPVSAAHLGEVEGRVVAEGRDGPILVQVPIGFGQVTFWALDLSEPPLSTWKALSLVCRKLVTPKRALISSEEQAELGSRLSHSGITDLSSQLHASLQDFPNIHRTGLGMVMALFLLYVLLIGPLDFLLTHKVLKKPQYTWVSFPLFVLLSGACLAFSSKQSNEQGLQVNQIDLVDLDTSTNLMRSRTWLSVYSPETRRYHVSVEPLDNQWVDRAADVSGKSEDVHASLSWYSVPENTLGGLNRLGGFDMSKTMYRFQGDFAGIDNLPIHVWATKSLTAQWAFHTGSFIENGLVGNPSGQLTGTLSHRFPFPLEDWILAYQGRVYRPLAQAGSAELPKLQPNEIWTASDASVYQRELKGYLTGTTTRRTNKSKTLSGSDRVIIEQTKYDRLNFDSYDVLRMLTFHESAGGSAYTGLSNYLYRELDLTNLLNLEMAVLYARIPDAAAQLKLDDQPVTPSRRESYLRIVLPVKQTQRYIRELPKFGDDDDEKGVTPRKPDFDVIRRKKN